MNSTCIPEPSLREVYLDRVLGGVAMLALHEAGALQGHLDAVGERWRLARRAGSVRQLLREQLDLLPEERIRVRHDHAVRRELWRGLVKDLRHPRLRRA